MHVVEKMRYYGLSEQKVLGVIRKPQRVETGIAPDTVAVMVPVGNIRKNIKPSKWNRNFGEDSEGEKWNQEIWVLYQIKKIKDKKSAELAKKFDSSEQAKKLIKLKPKKLIIISAWRYPGVSPEKDPIPAEIWREIEEMGLK